MNVVLYKHIEKMFTSVAGLHLFNFKTTDINNLLAQDYFLN